MGSQSDGSSDMVHAGAIAKPILRFLVCIVAVFVVTAVIHAVFLPHRALFAVLIFLFVVLIVSTSWGFHYALFVSLLAALGFSWLLPPFGRFWLSDSRDIFALVAFLVIGITTSHLSERARKEAQSAKRAEAAARRSEAGLREVIETMPAMAWSALPDGSNAFVNKQWAEYTGLSAEQTEGSGWRSTVHPEDLSGYMEKWRQSLATGQPFEHEARLRRTADGQYRWFLIRGMPLRDERDEVLKWYGVATDIEDRKQAEEALQKGEERWRSVFENSAIGVALTDLNGRFLATNHVFQAMVGYTEEELRALTFLDVTHEHNREANRALVTELVGGKRLQFQIEKQYRRKDGSLIWVSNNVSLVPGTEGVPQFLMALSEDITERKRAEAFLTGEKRILEMVAKGDPLPQILDSVCRFVEEHASGVLASILLFDGDRLRHGGAPGLPKAYTDAIDGAVIGPSAGSCGTAAYRGEQVIVEDIATDSLWAAYRDLALPHSLRACWSTPVFSSQGRVIATFAMYYREPRSPSPRDQGIIEQTTHLAGVAIERKLTQEALRRSEAYLAEAQRLSKTGSWAWDPRSDKMIYGSEELYRIFGVDPHEPRPSKEVLLQRVHPEDRDRVRAESARGGRDKTERTSDYKLLLPDGTIKYVLSMRHPVLDGTGELVEVIGTTVDVTERKRAEEALRRGEAHLAEAQRLTHTGSWAYRSGGREGYWSQETFRIFQYERTTTPTVELVLQLVHPEDADFVRQTIERSSRDGKDFDFEHRLRMPDGSVKHLRVVGRPSKDESGSLEFVGAVMDVSDRKRAEERLRRSEADLLEAQRISQTGSWKLDVSSGTVIVSPQVFRIFGVRPDEETSTPGFWLGRNHPEDQKRIRERFERSTIQKTDYEANYRIVLPDGAIKHLHAVGHPVLNESGDLAEFLGTVMDVTEQVQTSAALENALQEIKLRNDALRANEQNLNLIINTIPALAWSARPDGSADFFNQHYLDYVGLSAEQGGNWGWTVAVHPDDLDGLAGSWQSIMASGKQGEAEARLRRFDGEYRWFLFRANPLRDESGNIVKWFGINTDIEDRKRAEEKLRRSEASLAEAQRMTQTGSWVWNVRTEALFWSQEVFRIYDCDPEMAPTWDFLLERVHPEDRTAFERRKKMEFTQKEWTDSKIDFRIVLPDGTTKHLHSIGHPVIDKSGEITEVVGTVIDVTQRKLAEEKLLRSEESLLEAQRLSHMGSWRHDIASGTVVVSPEIHRIFGVQPDEDASSIRFWLSRSHPEDQQRFQELFERCESQKTDYEANYRIVLPDGTIKHLHEIGHPVLNQSGKLAEMIGTTIDVTERKRAEEERERLRQLEADLAHMNRVTMLGELASSLAHELNQPIAAAITSANACLRWLARNPPDLERARAAAMRIENDGSRAAEIIQRLRAFYKTGAPPQRELVDLNQVAEEMLELLRNEADRHSISLRTELALQLPQIMADRVQMQQVLMNLMLNGIEAMTDEAGELTIRSQSAEDGLLLISVCDTGVGLPSEKQDRIFNAFYTTKAQGTGMGLAISRSIIEAHGGRLWATANAERGATFHFTFPAELQQ